MHLRSYTRSGTEVHCMVKQRFSTADCAAEIGCLKQRVLGFRLANIYDINPKACPYLSTGDKKISSLSLCIVWLDVMTAPELSLINAVVCRRIC